MLGYMTAKQALAQGFTHHGRQFFVPVWLAPYNAQFPVAAKWAPMELVLDACIFIESALFAIFYPRDEYEFKFLVGPRIKQPGS